MSNFRRLTNLAKGKLKSLTNPSTDPPDPDALRELHATLQEEADRLKADLPRSSARPRSKKHEILDKLLANGLLSQSEYDEKVAALEGGTPAPTPDERPKGPPKPKKRRL